MVEEEKWSIFAPSPSSLSEAKTIIEELLQDKPVRKCLKGYVRDLEIYRGFALGSSK